jgi:hypothetical protein
MGDGGCRRLYPIFSEVYRLIAEHPELERTLTTELATIAKELRKENIRRRDESATEMKIVSKLTKDFDCQFSPAWKAICARFGENLKASELFSIAQTVYEKYSGQLSDLGRLQRRRKTVLLKWYDENWPFLESILPFVTCEC